MNKYIIPAVATSFLIIVVGGFAYWQNNQSSSSQLGSGVTSDLVQNNDKDSSFMNLKMTDLLNTEMSYHCTFSSQTDPQNASSGEIYVAQKGQKMRGSFMTKMSDEPDVEGNILRDGQYQYIWQTGENEGMKLLITESDNDIFSIDNDDENDDFNQMEDETFEDDSVDESADMNFSCLPWKVDEAMFSIPSDINFVDFQAQMDELNSSLPVFNDELINDFGTDEEPSDTCAICDQVPAGQAKQECMSALGCN